MSQQHEDATAFIMGTGVPSAKFPVVGTAVSGTITQEPVVQQQTDFDTGDPLVWQDGKPRLQAKVVLTTDERSIEIPDDDGSRAVYIKGQLQKAVATAVRAAGGKKLEVGGRLTITYASDGQAQGRKNPPKVYTAKYEPPDPLATVADPQGDNTSGGNGQAEQPPPGFDAAAWAAMPEEQKALVRTAMEGKPPY